MSKMSRPRAVVLLSGGLDSATVLAMAQAEGFECYAISFNYGQRHLAELEAAKRLAKGAAVADHKVIGLDLDGMGGSSLTDHGMDLPAAGGAGIPSTYVPARNTVFLALALGWAEVLGAQHIFIGVNAVDYSGYPDCRPEFIEAFQQLANLATRAGVEGARFQILAPLEHMSKGQIIQAGIKLGVNYEYTVSCYQADDRGRACGICDSCKLRADGFASAGVDDPTRYV